MKITIILSSEGKNLELANKFQENFNLRNCQSSIINLLDLNFPLYTPRVDSQEKAASLIAPIKESLTADGFVFLSPEYNGGPPPVFSNFIAWVSRSTRNWRETFSDRPAVIGTFSGGGGTTVLSVMRLQLSMIGMIVLGRQVLVTPQRDVDPVFLADTCNELIRLAQR